MLGVVAAFLVLAQAVLLARVAARSFDGATLAEVETPTVLLVVVIAARALATWGFEAVGTRAATGVLSQLRLDLVTARLTGRPTASDGAESAAIATAAVDGVDALEGLFGRYLPQLVLAAIVPVAVLILVAVLDPISAGLMILTLPLIPVFFWLIGRATANRARERWQAMSLLATHFLDVVRGLPTLRAFNRGDAQVERIEQVSDEYRSATMGTLRLAFLSGTVLELAATLGVALVAVSAGVRLVNGSLGLQTGLTVLVLAPELYLPFRRLGAEYHASADGLAVADRMFELLDRPGAALRVGRLAPTSPAQATVRFEGITFRYPSRAEPAVTGLDLELRPGETVALTGESGAGKSTVAHLLLGLLRPSAGRITVAGVPLDELDADAWRRLIAWVPQHPTVFHGTVAGNIRLGDSAASDERVREAARLAQADVFIRDLPEGYDTVIGDGGRQLSAGERRRVALARALLRDAPLIVLDEPTADLDPETAAALALELERAGETRTMLVIAHRRELTAHADRLVRLANGAVEKAEPTAVPG